MQDLTALTSLIVLSITSAVHAAVVSSTLNIVNANLSPDGFERL